MLLGMEEGLVCVLVPRERVPEEWLERASDISLVRLLPEEAAAFLRASAPGRATLQGSRSSRPAGWEALTETERKVALLVAEGLTNPEIGKRLFVSPRTVSTHLKHTFAKLGVSSRVELATMVARRGGAVDI